mgnify:CR=1 FL=1
MLDNGLKINSCSINLRNIRTIFNYAIDNDETELYPFRKFKIAREETRKRSLKAEQLITLRDFKGEEISKAIPRHVHANVLPNWNKRNRFISFKGYHRWTY